MALAITQKYFTSFDGTKIGYQIVGHGRQTIVLCNGLGGTMIAWSPLYNEFGNRYRFVTWDYRGLFSSAKPRNLKNLEITHHCRDLECLLATVGVTKAVFGGWSMGVQVCLEHYRKNPRCFHRMFLVNGTSGYPFHTALNSPLSKYVMPKTTALLKAVLPKLQPRLKPLAKFVIDSKEFISIVAKLGMINKTNLDSDIFRKIANEMINTDLSLYQELLDRLNEHDASDVLPNIKVPVLIIAGTKDIMTPSYLAEDMAKKIPGAELLILNNASHYSLMEFPEIINKRVEQFLAENHAT